MIVDKSIKSVYYYRQLGKEVCNTEGTEHYRVRNVEPIEIAIENEMFEDFALTNIVKYALRFKHTRNTQDLKKVADYAHLLAGVETENMEVRLQDDLDS